MCKCNLYYVVTWCNLSLISRDSQFHCCRITKLSKQQLYLLLNNRDLFQGNTVIPVPVSAEILIRMRFNTDPGSDLGFIWIRIQKTCHNADPDLNPDRK